MTSIKTTIAPSYFWSQVIMAVVCLVLGVWGAYDLWVKIPGQERVVEVYTTAVDRAQALAALSRQRMLSEAEAEAYRQAEQVVNSVDESKLKRPGTWDRLTQWMFISLLTGVPYYWWTIHRAKAKVYLLDEAGDLHLPENRVWKADEIADIDMSIWMKKSIAHVVHTDGAREKLDAHLNKNLDLIIGRIASQRYPEAWDEKASPIKKTAAPSETEETAETAEHAEKADD